MFSQLSQISPIDTPQRDPATAAPDAHSALADLRRQVDELKRTLGDALERRTAQAAAGIHNGAEQLRHEIRGAPVVAVAIAALAGVLVAIAITQQRPPQTKWQYAQDQVRRAMPDIDMGALRERLADASTRVRDDAYGLLPSVEQLAQAVSRMESTSIAPMLDKGATFMRGIWDLATNARNGMK